MQAILFCLFLIFEMEFLCSPDCPGTCSADQAGLKLGDPPASASQVLGLKGTPPQPTLETGS